MTVTYNPLHALLIFFIATNLLWLTFRPDKGWFWLIKNKYKVKEKIVIEDILKLLYRSEKQEKNLNIHDVSRILKYKDAFVISSINSMISENLISFKKERLLLTQNGKSYALRIIRMHRLWEKYLAEKTGFDKSKWHRIAEQKEHETNEEQANLMASKLGNPIFDPHGDPIPTSSGKIAQFKSQSLSSLSVGKIGKIVHIEDNPDVIYKQIVAKDIHIGSQIRVIENSPNQVIFYSEGEEFKLTPIVAGNIDIATIEEKDQSLSDDIVRLTNLKIGETATIVRISKESRGEARRRLLDLGFVRGAKIKIDLLNPLGEPNAYLVKETSIVIRNNQASKILIKKAEA